MATYDELHTLFGDGDLRRKIEVAVIIAADNIRQNGAATAAEKRWAAAAFNGPSSESRRILLALLAANNTAAVGTITSASDATIQAAVDGVVPMLAEAAG